MPGLIKNMTFCKHIDKKCLVARNNLVKIARIRKFLSRSACESIIISLVISHLDYCNSLLYGVSDKYLRKLQIVQNDASCLILRVKRSTSATKCLKELHWLPIKPRIEFKIVTIVYKCVTDQNI